MARLPSWHDITLLPFAKAEVVDLPAEEVSNLVSPTDPDGNVNSSLIPRRWPLTVTQDR